MGTIDMRFVVDEICTNHVSIAGVEVAISVLDAHILRGPPPKNRPTKVKKS